MIDPGREADLVRRSQSGDRAAFEELIRAYARLLWASAYGALGDRAATEDVVQETFARAWKSLKELKEPGAFRGWLLTIAKRLAWRRAEVDGRFEVVAAVPDRPAREPEEPDEALGRVREALSRLPERYRLPVTLHFLNGMEYEAISREMGLSNGSLRGLVARGIGKLRAELAPWWRKRDERA